MRHTHTYIYIFIIYIYIYTHVFILFTIIFYLKPINETSQYSYPNTEGSQVCRATGAVAHALALLRDVTARRWRIDAEALAMAAMARKDSWQRALAFWDESRQVSGPGLQKRWRNGEKWRFIAGKT